MAKSARPHPHLDLTRTRTKQQLGLAYVKRKLCLLNFTFVPNSMHDQMHVIKSKTGGVILLHGLLYMHLLYLLSSTCFYDLKCFTLSRFCQQLHSTFLMPSIDVTSIQLFCIHRRPIQHVQCM